MGVAEVFGQIGFETLATPNFLYVVAPRVLCYAYTMFRLYLQVKRDKIELLYFNKTVKWKGIIDETGH